MTEHRPILKLKLPTNKEVLVSKLPPGAIVEKKQAANKVLPPKPPKVDVKPTPKVQNNANPKKAGASSNNKVAKKNWKKPTLKTPLKPPALVTYKLYAKMLAYFQEKYPKCFSTPPALFAVGIHKELFKDEVELGVSRKQIRVFCAIYCAKPEYKESLKLGAPRLDLLGNTTSSVTEEELTPIKSMEKKL